MTCLRSPGLLSPDPANEERGQGTGTAPIRERHHDASSQDKGGKDINISEKEGLKIYKSKLHFTNQAILNFIIVSTSAESIGYLMLKINRREKTLTIKYLTMFKIHKASREANFRINFPSSRRSIDEI